MGMPMSHHIIDRVYCLGHRGTDLCSKIDMDTVEVGVVLTDRIGLLEKNTAKKLGLHWIVEGSKDPYKVDASHTDPVQELTGVALKYRQRARVAEEINAKMLGFLNHYFEAHETRSRASIWVHIGCEQLLKEIQK